MHDGQRVSYIGPPNEGLVLGDHGSVLLAADHASHVIWQTGSLKGQVTLVEHDDLTPLGRKQATIDDGLEDSLDVGSISITSAREVYEAEGEEGILNRMAQDGHLACFAAIAQEAQDLITTRIRNDPSFRALASHLDDDETESVIALGASVLLRDAFGVGED
jgi:hypothetical protein